MRKNVKAVFGLHRLVVGLLAFFGLMATANAQVEVTATAGTTVLTTYTTLIDAFAAINNGTHQGSVTVSLTSSPSVATASAVLTASGVTGASYTSVVVTAAAPGIVVPG